MNNGIKIVIIGFAVSILGYIIWYLTVARYGIMGLTHESIELFPTIGGWMSIIGMIVAIVGLVVFAKTRKNKINKNIWHDEQNVTKLGIFIFLP